jgi:hypothetical protein
MKSGATRSASRSDCCRITARDVRTGWPAVFCANPDYQFWIASSVSTMVSGGPHRHDPARTELHSTGSPIRRAFAGPATTKA